MNDDLETDVLQLVAGARRAFTPSPADAERVFAATQRALSDSPASEAGNSRASSAQHAIGSSIAAKLSVGMVGLGVALAVAHLVTQPAVKTTLTTQRDHTNAPLPASEPTPPVSLAPTPQAPLPAAGASSRAAREITDTRGKKRPRAAASLELRAEPALPPTVSLQDEIRALRRAETALRDGQPERALNALGELERSVPNGKLNEEREAAFVIACCALIPEARAALFNDYVQRHPKSMYLRRVEANCRAKSQSR